MKIPYRGILSILGLLAAIFLLPQSRPFAQSSGSSYATPSYSSGGTPAPSGTPAPGYSSSALYLPSGPEGAFQYPGNLNFKVPVSLTGHSFSLKYFNGTTTVNGSASVMGIITAPSGTGGAPVALYLAVAAPQPTTTQFNLATTDWWLADTTGNLEPRTAHRTYDLRTVYWRTFSGAPNRYFAIPDTRVGHSLFAGFPAGGWTAMSAGPVVWTYGAYPNNQPVSLHYFVGLAPAMGETMDAYLYLVDRAENRKTPWAQTDVRVATDWVFDPDYLTFPSVQVRATVEACEVGHTFTVHSRLPNMPKKLL